jgi:hypothetical protein
MAKPFQKQKKNFCKIFYKHQNLRLKNFKSTQKFLYILHTFTFSCLNIQKTSYVYCHFCLQWIADWVGPRTSLDNVEKRKSCSYWDGKSDPSAVQPIPSPYTDCTILAHIKQCQITIILAE